MKIYLGVRPDNTVGSYHSHGAPEAFWSFSWTDISGDEYDKNIMEMPIDGYLVNRDGDILKHDVVGDTIFKIGHTGDALGKDESFYNLSKYRKNGKLGWYAQ